MIFSGSDNVLSGDALMGRPSMGRAYPMICCLACLPPSLVARGHGRHTLPIDLDKAGDAGHRLHLASHKERQRKHPPGVSRIRVMYRPVAHDGLIPVRARTFDEYLVVAAKPHT